jgi:hypothetical protein
VKSLSDLHISIRAKSAKLNPAGSAI